MHMLPVPEDRPQGEDLEVGLVYPEHGQEVGQSLLP